VTARPASGAVIDAHTHVWRAVIDHPDPAATIVSPVCDVGERALIEHMDEHGVDGAVLVQPVCAGFDNSLILDLARADPARFAGVCAVDPNDPAAGSRLEHWAERGCRGVRLRPLKRDEEGAFESRGDQPVWEAAQRHGLVVSVYAGRRHLPAIRRLAERFPDVDVVIDHMAQPDPEAGATAPGWSELLSLAAFPRVHVKVSGFYYFTREEYPYRGCRGLLESLRETFGAGRLLWGSDYPHTLLRSGYARSVHLPARALPDLQRGELAAIMGGTARALYWPA
jgi:predicted TIM-barrel fold metal-dependent hydrolase